MSLLRSISKALGGDVLEQAIPIMMNAHLPGRLSNEQLMNVVPAAEGAIALKQLLKPEMISNILSKKKSISNVADNLKSYYRGTPKYKFGYNSLEEAGTNEEELMRHDPWLGKGYWYSENPTLAQKYGENVEKVSGRFNIFDPDKSNNKELIDMWMNINNSNPLYLLMNEGKQQVENFRQALQNYGYDGMKRFGMVPKDSAEWETMFFKKPQGISK